jgi:hypothetical protein
MRYSSLLSCIVISLLIICSSRAALACSDSDYKDKLTGLCLPKASSVLPNPVNSIPSILVAVTTGDPAKIAEAVGSVYLNSGACTGCTYAAQKIFPKLSKEQVNLIAGEGFLTFVGTGDPVITFVDVATNTAHQASLADDSSQGGPSVPRVVPRGPKQYSATADCILGRANEVYAGWKDAPVLTDVATGTPSTFPNVDLLEGDAIAVKSRLCDEWNDASTGQTAKAQASLVYKRNKLVTQPNPNLIKFFLIGTGS